MNKLLIATNNQGKVLELQELLTGSGVEFVTPAQINLKLEVEEDGSNYQENAGKKAIETAERSYYYAQKRYDVGMMATFELITNQNNLFTVKLQNALNQYDYVFKMKVLEFYKGQGLKF